ncbi:STAS domain-containing protein [Geofilum sp. OHC36d9]|uniref:STAS domain-containing protein n=1 Tax=Geofilum sp. OHC36d9 TaxID=3458413 RepID=UPI00403450CE
MLKLETKGNVTEGILEGTNRLNATIAQEVKISLNNALKQSEFQLILNLKNILFIDSTGIGVLISALKTSRQNNGTFILKAVNKDVMSLLTLMKLDKVFDFSESTNQN